jgi:glycosyltransferase involved in cell wall biosynthesis
MSQLNISPELSVVIPVYNEQETIGEILRKIQAVDLDKEIIIVDDYSTDKTRAFLKVILEANSKSPAFRLSTGDSSVQITLRRFSEKNLGKGAALTRFARSEGADDHRQTRWV